MRNRNNCQITFQSILAFLGRQMSAGTLSPTRQRAIAKLVEAERAKRGLSIEALGKKAGYNERTIRNLLAGKSIRLKTLNEICQALDIEHDSKIKKRHSQQKITDEDHGAYTIANHSEHLGLFYAYRRSFTFPKNIVRTVYRITWDVVSNCMRFEEFHQYISPQLGSPVNHDQSGEIFHSDRTGLLHLLTKFQGALRLITLSRLEYWDSTMKGIVLTQSPRPHHHQPAVSAIRFEKVASGVLEEMKKRVGVVDPNDPEYATLDAVLRNIELNYGIFALAPRETQSG